MVVGIAPASLGMPESFSWPLAASFTELWRTTRLTVAERDISFQTVLALLPLAGHLHNEALIGSVLHSSPKQS